MTRKRLLIAGLVVAAIAATALYAAWLRRDTYLQGSGTVEARDIRVGSRVGGRVERVLVREGDQVEPGQVLVTFEDNELRAALEQSRAAAEKVQRGYRPEEIAEARAAVLQATAEYEQRKHGYRQEEIAGAQAELERAKAEERRTRLDSQRMEALAQKDIVSRQQRDTAEANWRVAVAQERATQQKLEELQQGYRQEEIAAAEARYLQAKAALEKVEHGNRREDIAAAKAGYAESEARFRERQVVAPAAATVEVLDVRPGDIIPPNTPVATLLERDQIYVRIYIPETQIGRVQVGQKAEVRIDSFPKMVFEGVVEQINQRAEFLPRNVQTREERVHQVFGVKVRINDPSRHVHAGTAADVKLQSAS